MQPQKCAASKSVRGLAPDEKAAADQSVVCDGNGFDISGEHERQGLKTDTVIGEGEESARQSLVRWSAGCTSPIPSLQLSETIYLVCVPLELEGKIENDFAVCLEIPSSHCEKASGPHPRARHWRPKAAAVHHRSPQRGAAKHSCETALNLASAISLASPRFGFSPYYIH